MDDSKRVSLQCRMPQVRSATRPWPGVEPLAAGVELIYAKNSPAYCNRCSLA
jgi:hypothetical protein